MTTESGLNEFDTLSASNTTGTLAPVHIVNLPEQTELDKVEAAALSVVHNIEEKMEIVEEKVVAEVKAVENKVINFHLRAGGGSIIRNPG